MQLEEEVEARAVFVQLPRDRGQIYVGGLFIASSSKIFMEPSGSSCWGLP